MAKNPEKIAGNTGACWKCNKPITCVKTGSYNGKDQLSWQNPDGSGHYKKIGEGAKDFACSSGSALDGFNTPVSKEPFVPKLITEEQLALWIPIVKKAVEYTLSAEEVYDEYPQMTNPAKRGLVTKLAHTMMENYQKVKDDD
tara:strand:+ start:101 stop:526 length:426 start_codon:yes stop_codon:yes gene_type:complete